jgi:hypothetical protein|tara:strand:- start:216 stop:344 length:129 start_codon:yes stop_codon:yes gene_type:complete
MLGTIGAGLEFFPGGLGIIPEAVIRPCQTTHIYAKNKYTNNT